MKLVDLIQILQLIAFIVIPMVLYILFQKRQLQIQRHALLKSLEDQIADLLAQRIACIFNADKPEAREFRSVLDNLRWDFPTDKSGEEIIGQKQPVHKFIHGARHWSLGTDKEGNKRFLASKAFQETLIWFRRITRAHRAGIIKDDDLTDLWRFILPFGFSGRLPYFAKYFQGEKDIYAIAYVIYATLRRCEERELKQPIKYFLQYSEKEDVAVLVANIQEYEELHRLLTKEYSSG